MQRTNIYLEERQTAMLDRLARGEGVSRAEVIRRLIDRSLAGSDDHLAADLQAINDSFGVRVEVDVAPRSPGERADHLTRMWQTEP